MIEGGCFCGSVRYTIDDGQYLVANCHCSMCRKTSAAPFVTWIIVPHSAFRYKAGQPKELQSSDRGKRYFCDRCGTPLVFQSESRHQEIDITVGSLDNPDKFIPAVAVHEESKLPWLKQTESSN